MKNFTTVLGLFVLLGSSTSTLHAQSFTPLGFLPDGTAFSTANGVSADGSVVVGQAGASPFPLAFRWEDGVMVPLAGHDGLATLAYGVSGDGNIVVGTSVALSHSCCPKPARWIDGAVSLLDQPGGEDAYSFPYAASADGSVIVGRQIFGEFSAIKWVNGTGSLLPNLEGLPSSVAWDVSADGSVIVGQGGAAGISPPRFDSKALRWTNGGSTVESQHHTGWDQARANAVSADGTVVVGDVYNTLGGSQPFRWENGVFTLIQLIAGGTATDVSADGSVMVGGTLGAGVIWDATNGWRNLMTVLTDLGVDLQGWTLLTPKGISDDGLTIVGQGFNAAGQIEAFRIGFGAPPNTDIVVNDTRDLPDADESDEVCDVDTDEEDNQCTLRAAIHESNRRGGANKITFDIEGNGPHTINVATPFDEIVWPVEIDATSQPGYSGTPVVALQGAGTTGIAISAGQSVVRGLSIGGFSIGIVMGGQGGNAIEGCHIGVSPAGGQAMPNGVGITVQDTPGHRIGGSLMEQRNVISGNTTQGVWIFGVNSTDNVISGNYIGTNATGDASLGNGAEGIRIDGAPGNTIGGIDESTRNIISGNAATGVLIQDLTATANVVSANFIGTNASGDAALANGAEGIRVEKAPEVIIGGETAAERNVISGNATHGVYVVGPGADRAQIKSNYIGVDASGSSALGNGTATGDASGHRGIWIRFANDVEIGGSTSTPGAVPGNVVSDNAWNGIEVEGGLPGSESGSANNAMILGNTVGMDAAGETLLANGRTEILVDGISINGNASNAKVGQAGGGNAIATNEGTGINLLADANISVRPDGAHIASNTIGFTAAGDALLGKPTIGISRTVANQTSETGGISDVVIGGEPGEGNQVIGKVGILVSGKESERNIVKSNTIGLLANGDVAITDEEEQGIVGISTFLADGVEITGNTIGGYLLGIELSSDDNVLKGNRIGTNPPGTQPRPNRVGISIPSRAGSIISYPVGDRNTIGGPEASDANVISGNGFLGMSIGGPTTFDLFSTSAATNSVSGSNQSENSFWRDREATGGLFSETEPSRLSSSGALDENEADNNMIVGNKIGTNAAGTAQLGNGRSSSVEESGIGVWIQGGFQNTFLGNVISGNGGGLAVSDGRFFGGESEQNIVAANLIGIGSDGSSIPNQFGGLVVDGASGPQLYVGLSVNGVDAPLGNVVARNGFFGMRILTDTDRVSFVEIRQSSFERNDGPSIEHFHNGEMGGPHVPDPPRMLSALALEQQASLRIGPRATGPVDVFSTTACEGGHADGFYRLSVEGTAGTSGTVLLDYALLSISTAEQATGLYLSTTSTSEGETAATSAFSNCLRIAAEGNSLEQFLIDGQTGDVFDGLGLSLNVTSNSSTSSSFSKRAEGTLYISRYDLAPDNNTFDGLLASTDDGTIIEPNVVSSDRYWTVQTDSLDGLVYTACVDISGLNGITAPGQLALARRDDLGSAWVPYPSTLEDNDATLCASGIESLGELGVGADSLVNPIYTPPIVTPVETPEVLPDAFELSYVYPNPVSEEAFVAVSIPNAGHVTIEVFDSVGRKVDELLNEIVEAGIQTLSFDAAALPAGIYFIRANGMGTSLTRTATVLR